MKLLVFTVPKSVLESGIIMAKEKKGKKVVFGDLLKSNKRSVTYSATINEDFDSNESIP